MCVYVCVCERERERKLQSLELGMRKFQRLKILTFIPSLLCHHYFHCQIGPHQSTVWITDQAEKERLISDYKNNTGYVCSILVVYDCSLYYRAKPCRHFQQGNGVSHFGNVCFYGHGELRTVLFLVFKKNTTITQFDQ